jgi:3,4-dihydroxy 2-butanone 4-phosphate synthase / GTP cyclohydrolase II
MVIGATLCWYELYFSLRLSKTRVIIIFISAAGGKGWLGNFKFQRKFTMAAFSSIEEVVKDIKDGKFVIVVDDDDRENEGDLIIAADKCTPEHINFLCKYARGLICMPITTKRSEELELSLMVAENTEKHKTAFTVSVDAQNGTTTGISASDRAVTVQTIIDPRTKPEDLSRPGHIFPLIAREGGVLTRAGHTETAVDLSVLAGCYPAAVICEIMNDDGTMARLPELEAFAKEHDLKILQIKDLIHYRFRNERLVRRHSTASLPTKFGDFKVIAYDSDVDTKHHVALVMGEFTPEEPVMVRVHSECLTGDVFHSLRCDCGDQLHAALKMIAERGSGVLVYMRQEGRGIGLSNKIKAYELQDAGCDTVEANEKLGFPADLRDYGTGAQILADLNIRKIELLTNNPKKIVGLEGYGMQIVKQLPIQIEPTDKNRRYLTTKKEKMGHLLEI